MLLKDRIQEDMKTAMRSQDKPRLGVIRLMLAAIKQYEVDERKIAEDAQVISMLDKMIKQRRESIQQYTQANRQDLADQEQYEITVIQAYLPQALTSAEIDELIAKTIVETGAKGVQEMSKVMAILKPQMLGRADMSVVSAQIKQLLSSD